MSLRASCFARTSFLSSSRVVSAIVAGAGLVAATALAPHAVRAEGAPGAAPEKAVIEYRQMVMGAIGANMGAIGGILKNQLPMPGAVANHAQQMADAAKLIGPAFKQNVVAGKTDAKAEIWKDWAKFEKAIADYEKAATNLATAAKGSDPAATGAAVKALGESCGGCHDPFRKPKEESFRNHR